jgi:hypothetical protein
VRWLPEIYGYGQSGDVAFWNASTKVMGLTEPPKWGTLPLYLTLVRDDGSLTTPVLVSAGPTANDVLLPAVPDFELMLDDGTRERPKFLLGTQVGGDEVLKVLAIRDGGKGQSGEQLYDIDGVLDDARVHAADNAYLPGPGVIQDPIETGTDVDTGGGTLYLTNLTYKFIRAFTGAASYTLKNDGSSSTSSTSSVPYEWMLYGVVEPAVAALYEVRASFQGGGSFGPPQSVATNPSGTGSWLNLGTTRSWSITQAPPNGSQLRYGAAYLLIEIRLVGTTIVLASCNVQLLAGTV